MIGPWPNKIHVIRRIWFSLEKLGARKGDHLLPIEHGPNSNGFVYTTFRILNGPAKGTIYNGIADDSTVATHQDQYLVLLPARGTLLI